MNFDVPMFRPSHLSGESAGKDRRPNCMNCATKMELHRCLSDPDGDIVQRVYECPRCRLIMTDGPAPAALQGDCHV